MFMGVFSLMVFAMVAISRRPASPPAPPLPPGKVTPYLSDDLLLAPDGTLWTISHSGSGGPTSLALTPLAPADGWKHVSGNGRNGVGIRQDGTLWLWRTRLSPVLSAPTFEPPVQIGLERDWAHAAYDWNFVVLLKTDGSLWYLGDEFIGDRAAPGELNVGMRPTRIGADQDWTAIATNFGFRYALKRDGTLWHWGELTYRGPLQPTPVPLSGDRDWSMIATCSAALAALKRDGSLWIYGPNAQCLADISSAAASGFIRVGTENHWKSLVGGERSLVVQHTDGSWWASGENHYAHLGLPHWFGHSKHLDRPTRIPFGLDVWAWSIKENTTLLLTRDGRLHSMGKTPGTGRPLAPGGVVVLKSAINRETQRIPGMPKLFARPGESWSEKPVKVGELPPSVISALQSGQ